MSFYDDTFPLMTEVELSPDLSGTNLVGVRTAIVCPLSSQLGRMREI